jgi:hypothetical protein
MNSCQPFLLGKFLAQAERYGKYQAAVFLRELATSEKNQNFRAVGSGPPPVFGRK